MGQVFNGTRSNLKLRGRKLMEHDLLEVVFGINHIIAEFFWNAVFAVIVYTFSKARTLRKIHKYVDSKHNIEHEEY